MSKHTPGPWKAEFDHPAWDRQGRIATADGKRIAIVNENVPSAEHLRATSRLIAEAPAMYALLAEFVSYDGFMLLEDTKRLVEAARLILAKVNNS